RACSGLAPALRRAARPRSALLAGARGHRDGDGSRSEARHAACASLARSRRRQSPSCWTLVRRRALGSPGSGEPLLALEVSHHALVLDLEARGAFFEVLDL